MAPTKGDGAGSSCMGFADHDQRSVLRSVLRLGTTADRFPLIGPLPDDRARLLAKEITKPTKFLTPIQLRNRKVSHVQVPARR